MNESKIKLSLKGIAHSYQSNRNETTEAIRSVDLEVRQGEFLAIVGSSGCGKSTLINIMCGMVKPTRGEVLIDGEPVDNRKHKIGYVSQSETLLPWRRILQNVALGLEIEGTPKAERLETARRLMEASGLGGFENKYPFELSGGMRKRAIIIRALAQNPDVVFMDEPFGPLDVFTREMLQQEILKMWQAQKNTIIYITHDIAEAITLADRIVLLSYRPAVIKAEYMVNLPRPRMIEELKYNSDFLALERQIWSDIKDEVTMAQQQEMQGGSDID